MYIYIYIPYSLLEYELLNYRLFTLSSLMNVPWCVKPVAVVVIIITDDDDGVGRRLDDDVVRKRSWSMNSCRSPSSLSLRSEQYKSIGRYSIPGAKRESRRLSLSSSRSGWRTGWVGEGWEERNLTVLRTRPLLVRNYAVTHYAGVRGVHVLRSGFYSRPAAPGRACSRPAHTPVAVRNIVRSVILRYYRYRRDGWSSDVAGHRFEPSPESHLENGQVCRGFLFF